MSPFNSTANATTSRVDLLARLIEDYNILGGDPTFFKVACELGVLGGSTVDSATRVYRHALLNYSPVPKQTGPRVAYALATLELRAVCASGRGMANALGLSPERCRQMVAKARRILKHPANQEALGRLVYAEASALVAGMFGV